RALRLQGIPDRGGAPIRTDEKRFVLAVPRAICGLALLQHFRGPVVLPSGVDAVAAFPGGDRKQRWRAPRAHFDIVAERRADEAAESRVSRLRHAVACATRERRQQGPVEGRAWAEDLR